MVTGSGINE